MGTDLFIAALGILVGWIQPYTPYQPHEDASCDAWEPNPASAVAAAQGAIEHCGPWVRNGYVSVQVNVDAYGCNIVGDAANEPSIAVDPTDPRRMAIGWRQFDSIRSSFRQPGWAYSHDGGQTWAFPGSIDPGTFGSDPVLASDSQGAFFYLTIDFDQARLFRSIDGGLSWPSRTTLADQLLDKPWMAFDRSGAVSEGNVYVMANRSEDFLRSTDGGNAFEASAIDVGFGHPYLQVGCDSSLWNAMAASNPTLSKSSNAMDPLSPVEFVKALR